MPPRGGGAPEQGTHPSEEHPGPHGLQHVIIGSELQAEDLVYVIVAGRHHEDRAGESRSNRSADLEPVDAWEHDVEDHEVEAFGQRCVAATRPVGGPGGLVTLAIEPLRDERRELEVVLHQEDAWG